MIYYCPVVRSTSASRHQNWTVNHHPKQPTSGSSHTRPWPSNPSATKLKPWNPRSTHPSSLEAMAGFLPIVSDLAIIHIHIPRSTPTSQTSEPVYLHRQKGCRSTVEELQQPPPETTIWSVHLISETIIANPPTSSVHPNIHVNPDAYPGVWARH